MVLRLAQGAVEHTDWLPVEGFWLKMRNEKSQDSRWCVKSWAQVPHCMKTAWREERWATGRCGRTTACQVVCRKPIPLMASFGSQPPMPAPAGYGRWDAPPARKDLWPCAAWLGTHRQRGDHFAERLGSFIPQGSSFFILLLLPFPQ